MDYHVVHLSGWMYRFSVASKDVGLLVYRLKPLSANALKFSSLFGALVAQIGERIMIYGSKSRMMNGLFSRVNHLTNLMLMQLNNSLGNRCSIACIFLTLILIKISLVIFVGIRILLRSSKFKIPSKSEISFFFAYSVMFSGVFPMNTSWHFVVHLPSAKSVLVMVTFPSFVTSQKRKSRFSGRFLGPPLNLPLISSFKNPGSSAAAPSSPYVSPLLHRQGFLCFRFLLSPRYRRHLQWGTSPLILVLTCLLGSPRSPVLSSTSFLLILGFALPPL